jgi:hypothetical protein
MLLRVAFADFGMQMLDVAVRCLCWLLAVIGCYPANVGCWVAEYNLIYDWLIIISVFNTML